MFGSKLPLGIPCLLLVLATACGNDSPAPSEAPVDSAAADADSGEANAAAEAGPAACVPGTIWCDGAAAMACSEDGRVRISAYCPYQCVSGTCSGVCTDGATDCDGTTPVRCAAGSWISGPPCSALCARGACVDACTIGDTICAKLTRQACGDGRAWQTLETCPFVCVDGRCAGACVPGSKQCAAEGAFPETCSADGTWVRAEACIRECAAGRCVVQCAEGARECSGDTPRVCEHGSFRTEMRCPGGCDRGECVPVDAGTTDARIPDAWPDGDTSARDSDPPDTNEASTPGDAHGDADATLPPDAQSDVSPLDGTNHDAPDDDATADPMDAPADAASPRDGDAAMPEGALRCEFLGVRRAFEVAAPASSQVLDSGFRDGELQRRALALLQESDTLVRLVYHDGTTGGHVVQSFHPTMTSSPAVSVALTSRGVLVKKQRIARGHGLLFFDIDGASGTVSAVAMLDGQVGTPSVTVELGPGAARTTSGIESAFSDDPGPLLVTYAVATVADAGGTPRTELRLGRATVGSPGSLALASPGSPDAGPSSFASFGPLFALDGQAYLVTTPSWMPTPAVFQYDAFGSQPPAISGPRALSLMTSTVAYAPRVFPIPGDPSRAHVAASEVIPIEGGLGVHVRMGELGPNNAADWQPHDFPSGPVLNLDQVRTSDGWSYAWDRGLMTFGPATDKAGIQGYWLLANGGIAIAPAATGAGLQETLFPTMLVYGVDIAPIAGSTPTRVPIAWRAFHTGVKDMVYFDILECR